MANAVEDFFAETGRFALSANDDDQNGCTAGHMSVHAHSDIAEREALILHSHRYGAVGEHT